MDGQAKYKMNGERNWVIEMRSRLYIWLTERNLHLSFKAYDDYRLYPNDQQFDSMATVKGDLSYKYPR